jgi:hypothetical protein
VCVLLVGAPLDLVAPDLGAVDFGALVAVFAAVLWWVGDAAAAVAGLVGVESLVELCLALADANISDNVSAPSARDRVLRI